MMRRLMIRNFRDVGPACEGKRTKPEICKAIIELAEPVSMDGYVVRSEVIACNDDPIDIALKLLVYGTVVI
jgi:hypothetical protein